MDTTDREVFVNGLLNKIADPIRDELFKVNFNPDDVANAMVACRNLVGRIFDESQESMETRIYLPLILMYLRKELKAKAKTP